MEQAIGLTTVNRIDETPDKNVPVMPNHNQHSHLAQNRVTEKSISDVKL